MSAWNVLLFKFLFPKGRDFRHEFPFFPPVSQGLSVWRLSCSLPVESSLPSQDSLAVNLPSLQHPHLLDLIGSSPSSNTVTGLIAPDTVIRGPCCF